jgi:hypothetical protein
MPVNEQRRDVIGIAVSVAPMKSPYQRDSLQTNLVRMAQARLSANMAARFTSIDSGTGAFDTCHTPAFVPIAADTSCHLEYVRSIDVCGSR